MTATATETGLSAIVMRETLLAALAGAKPLTNLRREQLQCVRLTTADAELTVEATDLSTFGKFTLANVQVEHVGSLLVNCEKLMRCLSEMVGDTVSMVAGEFTLTITSNDGPVTLATLPADRMPKAPDTDLDSSIDIAANVLSAAMASTLFTAKDEDTRYAVRGVHLARGSKSLDVVASDTKRVALVTIDVAKGKPWSAMLPSEAARVIVPLLEGKENVTVSIGKSHVRVEGEWYTITATQLEGAFVPYADAFPKDFDKRVTVSKSDLLRAVRQACIVAEQDIAHTKLAFECSKKGIRVRSGIGSESANIEIACKYEGADITIGASGRKFLEGLTHAPGDEVKLDFVAPNRPFMLSGEGTYRYLQMPINLQ